MRGKVIAKEEEKEKEQKEIRGGREGTIKKERKLIFSWIKKEDCTTKLQPAQCLRQFSRQTFNGEPDHIIAILTLDTPSMPISMTAIFQKSTPDRQLSEQPCPFTPMFSFVHFW